MNPMVVSHIKKREALAERIAAVIVHHEPEVLKGEATAVATSIGAMAHVIGGVVSNFVMRYGNGDLPAIRKHLNDQIEASMNAGLREMTKKTLILPS